MMEDPFSFFITQQLTVGNVRSLTRLYTEVVTQPELQFRLQTYLERMQQLGFLALNGDEIVVNKMGFRFKLDRRAQGRLLPTLFETSTHAAIRAVDKGDTAPVLFLISEDPVTAGEVSAAIERFRADMRQIGERVKSREPVGVRIVGLFNTPMLAQDYLSTPDNSELREECSPGTFARRIHEVSQAAHDLAPVLGSLNLVLSEAQGALDEDVVQILALATERLRKIHQDFLPESRRKVETEKANALDCARNSLAELSKTKAPHIRLEYLGPDHSSALHQLRQSELQRTITNLLKNALEAVGEQGNGVVSLELKEQGDTVELSIQDNGPGFAPQVLVDIKQARWTTTKPGGNGLGVRHAIDTAQKAGGDLFIDSVIGEGTIIRLSLPILKT